jgi:hypothetical protein
LGRYRRRKHQQQNNQQAVNSDSDSVHGKKLKTLFQGVILFALKYINKF